MDWSTWGHERHQGLQSLVRDLNYTVAATPALHLLDCEPAGFQWVIGDDADQSVFAWLRFGGENVPPVLVVCNFTPVPRGAYRIGLPYPGRWREIINTNGAIYGGSDTGNMGALLAEDEPSHGQLASAKIFLPPLATVFLMHDPD